MSDPTEKPSDPAEGSITWFFGQLRHGDDLALVELWQRFFPRLMGLAARVLADRPQRAASAEDAVQEALVSFWRRARAGEFESVADRDHLWQLLAQITVFKARRQVRSEAAEKRGGGRILGEGDLADRSPPQALDALAWHQPTAEVDVRAEELLDQLPPELREFAVLHLLGHTSAEVADLMGCTQRKVQRKLELVRLRWERLIAAE
ncbi:MAG: ECF-type sigma factor [Planctomycetaceae bacterium]|nr:ECF-type sigma factor [Planctomycetaceae bacterium]